MFFRVCFLSLGLAFVTFSCRPAESSPPSTNPALVTSPVVVTGVAPSKTEIALQKELVFIEFFAGT